MRLVAEMSAGLKQATQVAVLNANYVAKKLEAHYPVLYKGTNGTIAHECIVDPRGLKATAGIEVEDIAKLKMPDLNCDTLESAVRTVAGTARSMGLDVK